MKRRFLNARSPLRLLEKGLHGGLGAGNLGVVIAAHGVGKTSFLVGVAVDELLREGRVLDLIHELNAMRREAGLELTDRVRLWIPSEDLLAYEDRIKQDTLAVSVELGELRLEKA